MSGRGTHYAGGAALGLAVGQLGHLAGHWPTASVVGLAAVAAVTAGGELSPDVDQFRWWRLLDKWLPDEWLGAGGPLQHRGITHWAAWPWLIAVAWSFVLASVPVLQPAWWIGYGVALGWLSHGVLDYAYGRAVRSPDGSLIVRAGVPFMPWWGHRGGLWSSGGIGSATMGAVLTVAAGWQAWLMVR